MSVPGKMLKAIEATKPTKPLVTYHYTGTEGLLGILRQGTMWASDIRYFSDRQAFEYPFSIVNAVSTNPVLLGFAPDPTFLSAVKELTQALSAYRIFAACFCEQGDLLSQWRWLRPRSTGYSIGFETLHSEQTTGLTLLPCVYDITEQEKLAAKLLGFLKTDLTIQGGSPLTTAQWDGLIGAGIYLVASLKDRGFSPENEWRLVTHSPTGGPFAGLLFRAAPIGVVPYVELELKGTNGRIPFIEEIFVDEQRPDLTRQAVDDYLLIHSIGNHGVLDSRFAHRA